MIERDAFPEVLLKRMEKQALIYTGVTTEKLPDGKEEVRQNQCIAWGDGKDYVKAEKNPVVTGDMLPEEMQQS